MIEMANEFGQEMITRRNELASLVKEGMLTESESTQSLAGWLLKQWDKGQPHGVFTLPTPQEQARYNAKAAFLGIFEE
jgi:hypothetical protein